MRNLAWFFLIIVCVARGATWNRPRYTGPLLGKWGCVICTTPIFETYYANGTVEYSELGRKSYATFEVDETHSPPLLITTERKKGKAIKGYCIWTITPEGKLRVEPFKSDGPVPTKFSDDPDPLLHSRIPSAASQKVSF